MEYLSTREAAQQWAVSLRQVQRLLHDNRIPGAKKCGVSWLIPAGNVKPPDLRVASPAEIGAGTASPCAVFPLLHIHGGDLAAARGCCQSDTERALLDAGLAFFRGGPNAAAAAADGIYKQTADLHLKLGSGLILALCAMAQGDAPAWNTLNRELAALSLPEAVRQEQDFVTAALRASLHGRGGYPPWLATGTFEGLSPSLFPAARWMYGSILYVKWKEIDLLAVAEPLIAECHRDRSDLCELYLRLLAATAHRDLGHGERARQHLVAAAALGRPLGLIQPFVDYRRQLAELLDEVLAAEYPAALLPMKKQYMTFINNWNRLYNLVWSQSIAEKLSPREFETCSLYSRGMQTNEIATRLGVSKSSVRKYLASAYNKLDICNIDQLRQIMHP